MRELTPEQRKQHGLRPPGAGPFVKLPNTKQERAAKLKENAFGLPLLWLDTIEPVLKAKDFVQGLLVEGSAAVIYGESNCGKTFWTTTLGLHVAAGEPWNGRRVDQGGVVYCVLEGGDGFRNRVVAWRDAHGTPGLPFVAIPSAINLLDPDADVERLIEAIKVAAAKTGHPVKLVIIDTLSRALAGGDENASQDMGALVANMDRIRQATGACLLFVHHSGKDAAKGARGHSLLRAAVDTEIEMRADDDAGTRTATVVKQRDLPKGGSFSFRLVPVVLGHNQYGEVVTTCVVESEGAAVPKRRRKELTSEEQGWLKDIRDYLDDPRQAHQSVRPEPDMPLVKAATRDDLRVWLQRRGRLESVAPLGTTPCATGCNSPASKGAEQARGKSSVAPGVAPSQALSATERSRLLRCLNKLKDKGYIGILEKWIWLL